jgi:hypothetical protein
LRYATTPAFGGASFHLKAAASASLFRLVSYRYGRGAMWITTNKSIR